uniref:Exportin-1 C-terminal domain-containing protein n=1 Tax=Plectus sambesii TaxID=2011161 RepID=A0A914WL50_9BILA
VLENFVPPLFDAVLFDYQRNVPAAREPEVLSLLATFVNRLEGGISGEVPRIFDAVFACTLEMINKDFHEFPDHRTNFFLLLQAVNLHCFDSFLRIPPQQFKLILDAVIWAFKHSMRNVAEIGLEILGRLLTNVQKMEDRTTAQDFYRSFFLDLLEHVLSVVTDSSQVQVAGLSYYAEILCQMFTAVESSAIISTPLNAENQQQSNVDFIYEFVGRLFKAAFPHLSDNQIRVTVKGFYSFNQEPAKMKEHLRDFLVQLKEFVGEDTTDLYLEEREAEIQAVQKKKQAVPGILNPHELLEEDMPN